MIALPQAFELAFQHHQAGRLTEAETLYRRILTVEPKHTEALHYLGVIAHQRGSQEAAVELIRESILLRPDNYAAHSNLGEALRALGRFDEAIASYRLALRLNPGKAGTHYNMGNALKELGQIDEAIVAYRCAIQRKPDFPNACINLGSLLRDRGEIDEAIAFCEQALRVQPDCVPALNNLGTALLDLRRLDDAIDAYRRALQINPEFAEPHTNLGVALAAEGDLDGAVAAHRRSIEIQPDYARAHSNLGNALKDQGQVDDAVEAYRHAVQLQPEDASMHSNLIYALHFQPNQDANVIAEEQQRWNRQVSDPRKRQFGPWANARHPERRLRIGYVSPDFRDHVVGRNLLPLFRCHDRASFEMVCYSDVLRPDVVTGEIRRLADHWRRTVGMSDAALAEMIRQDDVDILVDVTQHMARNRLPVFAGQPAPVQVSFAGYPESAGVDAIQYRISDRWLESGMEIPSGRERSPSVPHLPASQPESTERSASVPYQGRAERVFLIESFWCYDGCEKDVTITPLPATENGWVTFGSLNNFCKVNEALLELWARVLARVPDSRLMLLSLFGSHRQRVLEFLERRTVASERVEFVEPRQRHEYLELYQQLDIALDPFPYGGHTTTLDALWMGVPVVSLAGRTGVARGGLSILSNLGMRELVTGSEADYVKVAVELARDVPRLTALRATLRGRLEASLLMDAPRFARQIEEAYRAMWKVWCMESGQ